MDNMAMALGFSTIQPRRVVKVQSPWISRVFIPISPRDFRYHAITNDEASDVAKKGAEAAQRTGEDVKDKAVAATRNVTEKAKEVAGKVTQDLTEKAKQTAQGSWETVKDTTQKIKETVVGKAEETKEAIKDSAENAKGNLNSKI